MDKAPRLVSPVRPDDQDTYDAQCEPRASPGADRRVLREVPGDQTKGNSDVGDQVEHGQPGASRVRRKQRTGHTQDARGDRRERAHTDQSTT